MKKVQIGAKKMANGLNRYLHGSVWSWIPGEHALIISNDEHNIQNPEVICLSVSKTQNGASVCIDTKNYVQCNQIHMVEKNALTKFEGAVSAPVLAAAKAKIGALLNINAEPGNLQPIRDTAAKLIGQLANIDAEYVPVATESAVPVAPQTSQIISDTITENVVLLNQPKNQTPSKTTPKHRGKKSKQEADKKIVSPRRKSTSYTKEDEAFVIDENHSADEIMQRFNLTSKKQAYALKKYLKLRRAKQQGKNL